jgi:hypothetical protein
MRLFLAAGLCFVLHLVTLGQQIIVNSNGDKIIMYPDGSWRALDAQDSLLLKQNLQKSETGLDAGQDNYESTRNKAEEQNFLIRQAHELRIIILEEEKKVQSEFRLATNAQFKAGEYLQNAEANKDLIEPERIEALSQDYDMAVKELRDAKQKQQEIKKLSAEVIDLTSAPEKITKKKLDQLKSKYNLFLTHYEHGAVPFATYPKSYTPVVQKNSAPPPGTTNATASSASTKTDSKGKGNSSFLPPGSRTRDYHAQPYTCKISIDTIDLESHRRQVQVAPSLIFTHTDPDLRPYFKDKELITCKGSLVKIGPYVYLTIDFHIGSSHSQNNFGALQKESLLRFKLLNGEYVSLYNIKTDRGHIDPYSGNIVFSGQYALGKADIKKLNSSALDKIRVLWATGYEDYDVYFIEFFKNQLNCLEEAE